MNMSRVSLQKLETLSKRYLNPVEIVLSPSECHPPCGDPEHQSEVIGKPFWWEES